MARPAPVVIVASALAVAGDVTMATDNWAHRTPGVPLAVGIGLVVLAGAVAGMSFDPIRNAGRLWHVPAAASARMGWRATLRMGIVAAVAAVVSVICGAVLIPVLADPSAIALGLLGVGVDVVALGAGWLVAFLLVWPIVRIALVIAGGPRYAASISTSALLLAITLVLASSALAATRVIPGPWAAVGWVALLVALVAHVVVLRRAQRRFRRGDLSVAQEADGPIVPVRRSTSD